MNPEHRIRGIKNNGEEGMRVGSASLNLLSAQGENKQLPYRGLREKAQRIVSFAYTSMLNEARACQCPALRWIPSRFFLVAPCMLRRGSEDITCQTSFPVHSTHRTTLLWRGGGFYSLGVLSQAMPCHLSWGPENEPCTILFTCLNTGTKSDCE